MQGGEQSPQQEKNCLAIGDSNICNESLKCANGFLNEESEPATLQAADLPLPNPSAVPVASWVGTASHIPLATQLSSDCHQAAHHLVRRRGCKGRRVGLVRPLLIADLVGLVRKVGKGSVIDERPGEVEGRDLATMMSCRIWERVRDGKVLG